MNPVLSSRWVPALGIGAVVLVLGAAVATLTWRLRGQLREEILVREGQTMQAVVGLQQTVEGERLTELGLTPSDSDNLAVVLQTSKLAGVAALRFFGADEKVVACFPVGLEETPLAAADWQRLRRGEPVVRFEPEFAFTRLFDAGDPGDETVPALEVVVPLAKPTEGTIQGAVQYWILGEAVAREFAKLDRRLTTQALAVWLVCGGLAAAGLAWAFRQLAAANRLLAARTEDLARANQELALAAKTSALGTMTAHLIHGIKNPVAGLSGLVRDQAGAGGEEWAAAAQLTGRLRSLVDEVVTLIRDDETGTHFDVTWPELRAMIELRTASVRQHTGVGLACAGDFGGVVPNRLAALVTLVLANLVANACEASARGQGVRLTVRGGAAELEFLVTDEAGGLPEVVRQRLFLPCTSGKEGGTGIGLAISRQLALHAGGVLELVRSDSHGTVFRLTVPLPATEPGRTG